MSTLSSVSQTWQKNLIVCFFGSVTTVVAMTVLLPFLPLYVESLGVHDPASIVQFSGLAYGATFFSAALVAPLWGRLADRYGRKSMLIRASLGMAIAMSLLGLAQNVWQLVGLRLLVGFLGGYSSGSMVLVATQTPKERSGWALGLLSSGILAGSLIGPLVGGVLPSLIGIRATFLTSGGVIFFAFLATIFLIREVPRPERQTSALQRKQGIEKYDKMPVFVMLATGFLLMLAQMSIEPILTVYVAELVLDSNQVTAVAGLVLAAGSLGSIVSASLLGKLADRVGPWNVLIACLTVSAGFLVPQAFVTASWQLVVLRFLMGLALGGLLPSIANILRRSVPETMTGRVLGYSTSAQYVGQVAGPTAGGYVGGHWGMRVVILGTCAIVAAGAVWNLFTRMKLLKGGIVNAAVK